MAKKVTKKSMAASRQHVPTMAYLKGRSDGYEWGRNSDPLDVEEFIENVGWYIPRSLREVWDRCSLPELRETLKSEGASYTTGFLQSVQDTFKAEHSALVFLRHQEGVEDGRLWASRYATDGQIARISEFAQNYSSRDVFVVPYRYDYSWTPAHRLTAYLLADAYPVDEDEEQLKDCTEFREFWQPFVEKPMDEVMSNLEIFGFRAGHKLQDCRYIAGFVVGALGLPERMKLRLSERTPTPMPIKGSTGQEC